VPIPNPRSRWPNLGCVVEFRMRHWCRCVAGIFVAVLGCGGADPKPEPANAVAQLWASPLTGGCQMTLTLRLEERTFVLARICDSGERRTAMIASGVFRRSSDDSLTLTASSSSCVESLPIGGTVNVAHATPTLTFSLAGSTYALTHRGTPTSGVAKALETGCFDVAGNFRKAS
jgi:hypothetical protein